MPFSLHQLTSIVERCIWFDKEPRRDRTHHVHSFREMPAFSRQCFQVFEGKDSVKLTILGHGKRDLAMKRQDGVDQTD